MLGVFKQCELTHRSVCTCSICVYPPLRPICFARNNMAVKQRDMELRKSHIASPISSLSSKNSTAHSSNIVTNEWIEGEREADKLEEGLLATLKYTDTSMESGL